MKILRTFGLGSVPSQSVGNPTTPAQQVTITDFTNRSYLRNFILTNQFILLTVPGVSAGIALSDLALALASLEAKLTWPPVITTQPQGQSVVHPAQVIFSVVASSEIPIAGYQWQISTNQGSTWTNLANTPTYSGVTTSSLTITDSTGQNGYYFRVNVTNGSGTTASNTAVLTVT